MAATIGRVLSKVSITPAKPLSTWTSGSPSRLSFGMRALSKRMTAVSEALMPSLCSSRSTVPPGCSRGTMNDLIAARPGDLSSVAHTTMWLAGEPAVTKIFSPLITYSSPSSLAVVDTAAESEPNRGSVIAIAAHTLPSRSSCSSVATPDIAALPRPWRGTERRSAMSPQLTSVALSTADMLPPLRFSFEASLSRNASAPANEIVLASEIPSKRLASVSSSTGYACSFRSYLREIGRIISAAPWWPLSMTACSFLGISKLIAMKGLSFGIRNKGITSRLNDNNALGDANRAQVAVPAFDGMFLGVTMAAEQLYAVEADLHALVGAEPLGQRRLSGERQTLLGAGRAAPGDQSQAIELDGDVRGHERHRLTVCDRLTEGLAFLDVGHHVVEHRVGGADRECGPAQPSECDRLGIVGVGGAVLAESGTQRDRHVVEFDPAERGGANPHAGIGLDRHPPSGRLDDEQRGLAGQLGADDEQFGVRGGGHQRFHAVQPVSARGAHRRRLECGRVEQRVRFGDRPARLGHVVAREPREIGGLLVSAAPMGEGRRDAAGRQDR